MGFPGAMANSLSPARGPWARDTTSRDSDTGLSRNLHDGLGVRGGGLSVDLEVKRALALLEATSAAALALGMQHLRR
jgi:hypothetical protein